LFDISTVASDCCDANQGRFDNWAPPTMDELDAFEHEVDNTKEALSSKLAVISFMECKARIDDWSDRELMSRLALVLSLEEGRDEVEEGTDDGGVDSKLAVILLRLIKVDADESAEVAYEDMMEVFATLDVAMAAAAAVAAAAEATLRATLILFCLLQIAMPSRKTSCKSFICRMSSLSWHELGLSILHFRARQAL
jgi:hypothetical protein